MSLFVNLRQSSDIDTHFISSHNTGRKGCFVPKSLRSQVILAINLLDNGEWRRAANLSSRILATYPLYVVAYLLVARAYLGLGELGTTAKLLQRVLSADPENAEAYLHLGLIFHASGAYPRAES